MKGRAITWHDDELAWIEANSTMPRAEMHAMFVVRFDRQDVSLTQIAALCKRRGLLTGRTGCFAKGQAPMNKGKKMPFNPNSAATRFKKGQLPANALAVGDERIDRDGYVRICVDRSNPWTGHRTHMAFKHRELWEQANGPVPDGHALKCIDGDKTNCDPANWEAVPKALLPRLAGGRRRRMPYDQAPDELKPALMAIAKVEHVARETRRGKSDG